jgi:citrate lyase subunit beta/citryl-CoA lyase
MPDIALSAKTTSLSGLLVGTNDLVAELRCHAGVDRQALVPALSQVVITARAFGLKPLDGPFNDFQDPGGLEIQCRQAAELGFDGKSLIHPKQIDSANRAFAPSAEELAWSRTVIAAHAEAEAKGAGVVLVEGKLIENLHVENAHRLVALAARIAELEAA